MNTAEVVTAPEVGGDERVRGSTDGADHTIFRLANPKQDRAEQGSDVKGRDVSRETDKRDESLALDPCLHFPHTAL